MYRNPVVILQSILVSVASLLKRRIVRLDSSKTYAVIHSIWTAGYYHWVTESLPRALLAKERFPEAIPLLPSEKYRGYHDSLHLLGCNVVEEFPSGTNVIIANPVMTESPQRFASTAPELLRRIREIIVNNAGMPQGSTFQGRKVYVSRKKARGRFVINEAEVEAAVRSYGFQVVCFEDLSFRDQVILMAETKVLISIHGAALTNMIFMPRGGTILELIPRKNGLADFSRSRMSFRHDRCYVELAAAMGHAYDYLECRSDAPWYKKTHMANLKVEISRLEYLLKAFGVGRGRCIHD